MIDDAGTDSLLTGELQKVDYSDATKDVEYTVYTRLGQPKTVVDVVGTHTFGYNAYGELASETIDGTSGGLYSRTITRDYENGTGETVAGRNAGFHIDTEYVVTYAYEPKTTGTGRLNRINGPGLPEGLPTYSGGAFYGYTANSDLVGSLTYKDTSGTAVASATRVYDDHRDLLEYVENRAGSGLPVVSKYLYASDGAGRRTSVVYTGSAFDPDFHVDFGYNDRGELTSAERRQGTTPGQGNHLAAIKHAFDYTYDPIGNRITYNVDDSQTPTYYCANVVNQYDATAEVAGCATPAETFDYDADGNLEADGTMTYVWNGENRLIEAFPTSPAANDKKVEFKYDYLGRRVEKKVYNYDNGWSLEKHFKFVYEGWNVVLVLNGAGTTQQKYTWGLDLSGTLGGAGGIGGLLAVEEVAGTYAGNSYWFAYDGNGNVGQILKYVTTPSITVTLAAHYEHDPYGNIIVASDEDSSDYVNANPFRFSTKWFDVETGMGNWGLRHLLFRLGRWANRDPIEELGGVNLYQYVRGNPVTGHDALGLRDAGGCKPPPSTYRLTRAALDQYAPWASGVFGWLVDRIPVPATVSLECSFVNASQRGFCLCTKRCKYTCSGRGSARLEAGGHDVGIRWSFSKVELCTKTLVFCVPSWEDHACENANKIPLDRIIAADEVTCTVDGKEVPCPQFSFK